MTLYIYSKLSLLYVFWMISADDIQIQIQI